jgi:hypothetical protein
MGAINSAQSIELKQHVEGDVLLVALAGIFSLKAAKHCFLEVLEVARRHKVKKVQVDGRALRGEPTTMERFYYGEFAAREYVKFADSQDTLPKFAYVLVIPVLDPGRFGENVAVNRGMAVKTFDNVAEAKAWLDTA